MNRARFLLGLASVLAGTTVLLAVLGVVYNLLILVFAVPFAVGTYMIWGDATGRIQARARKRSRSRRSRKTRARVNRQRAGPGGRGGVDSVGRTVGGDTRQRRSRERRTAPTVESGQTNEEARQVLGVDAGADEAEIKRAYRERAKEVHPDRSDGDAESFKRVTDAYEQLVEE